ncbi:hypothetical protein TWF481_001977 [Arthrobotrys musiformis]|uniref:Uncharacterized protein n=1 Tax=Arthrobotrys musiformis TaxID=47236 RepID=A0AAV9VWF7_9PEZI
MLDPLINGLIPEREFNPFCRSNSFFSPLCPFSKDSDDNWSYETSLDTINECRDVKVLAGLMFRDNERFTAWNFKGIRDGTLPTTDFRRPPGSLSLQDTRKWVQFVYGFATAAWGKTTFEKARLYQDCCSQQTQEIQSLNGFMSEGTLCT